LSGRSRDIDIAKSVKITEWLKSELVDSVATLFKALLKADKNTAGEALSAIIIVAYLLARRIGLTYDTIDLNIQNRLSLSINNSHEIEKWYGDLTNLIRHMERKMR